MAQCAQCGAEAAPEDERCPTCGEPAAAPEVDELLGREILGRYRLVRLIAEGGMGRVYLAEQAVGTVTRKVAVKVLRRQLSDDRQLVSRFSREAETLVRLTHPNTVQLFDFGALPDGTLALVMEYVEGHSLAKELARGPLPLPRVERLLVQLCAALREAHAHGIVHRDLKPDNFVITNRGGHGDFVKVLDFGIAKVSAADEAKTAKLTQHGMIIGTPPYMSPEQFSAEPVDARSDVYSLGVIVYEMLTGRLPFEANTPWEWATKHLAVEPAPIDVSAIPGASERHVVALRRALAKKVDQRAQSVDEFLALFCGTQAVAASGVATGEGQVAPIRPTTTSFRPRSRKVLAAATGLVALLAGSVLYAVRRDDPAPAQAVGAAPPILPDLPGREQPSADPAHPAPAATPRATAQPASERPVAEPARPEPAATRAEPEPPAREPSRRSEPATTHGRSTSRAASRTRESTPAAPPPTETPFTPPPAPPPAPTVVQAAPPPMPPALGTRPAAPPPAVVVPAEPSIPSGLQWRLDRMKSNMNGHLEQAAADYAAAETNYGSEPALRDMRAALAKAGEARVRSLLRDGDCKQAQALQRALVTNGVVAGSTSRQLFTGRCDPP